MGQEAPVPYAHPHLGFQKRSARPIVSLRCMSQRVALPVEDLVYFLIAEVGIEPLKPEWRDIPKEAKSVFNAHKTW